MQVKKKDAEKNLDFVDDKKLFIERLLGQYKLRMQSVMVSMHVIFIAVIIALNLYVLYYQRQLMKDIKYYISAMNGFAIARSGLMHLLMPIWNKKLLDEGKIDTGFEFDSVVMKNTLTEFQDVFGYCYGNVSMSSQRDKYYKMMFVDEYTRVRYFIDGQIDD